jgi:hypothetical protein
VKQADIKLDLHPKQDLALKSRATEVFYGGAAGGGKSHLMRVAAILWCASIPGLQVYLFRRVMDDLFKNHMEGPKGFRGMLEPWVRNGFVQIVGEEIRFWNKSKIFLCHCKDDKDVYKYFGAEIHVLLIDELTHFTDAIYRLLRSRVRMVGIDLPEQFRGCFPRILASSNPGNIGHHFVKKTFIDGAIPYEIRQMPKEDGGMKRQFIRATLDDNPSMAEDDPNYGDKLEGLGSKALVQAIRHGDWDVIEGAFFDNFDRKKHVVRPQILPKHWTRFMSGDPGSAYPFCYGWYAVASEETKFSNEFGERVILPRGGLVKYREYYGAHATLSNKGLKMTAEAVARKLIEYEPEGENIAYRVLDPKAWSEDGGRSYQQRMTNATPPNRRMIFRKADNSRVPEQGRMAGWDQVRSRLEGDLNFDPMLIFFETCVDTIRTLPALMHDKAKIEDVDTDGEDHAGDETRYACNSRPWESNKPSVEVERPADYKTSRIMDDEDEGAYP